MEHRLVERLVGDGAQVAHVLGVDVVDEAAALLEGNSHGKCVVQSLEEVPAGAVVTDEEALEEHPSVAATPDGVGGRVLVVGTSVGDDDDEGRRLHLLDRRLRVAVEHAAAVEEVAVTGELCRPRDRVGEVGRAAGTDAVAVDVAVEVVELDLGVGDAAVEEDRRHGAVVVDDDREAERALDHVLHAAVGVEVAHRTGAVHHEDDLPRLVGVDLLGHHRLGGGVDLLGHQTPGALLGVGVGCLLLGCLQIRHIVNHILPESY